MIIPVNKRVYGVFPEEKPVGGILLVPENELNKTKLIVIAVSNDIDDIEPGDTIIIKQYAGIEVDGEDKGLIVEHKDILAVLE